MSNRLRFVHRTDIFPTRKEAVDFLTNNYYKQVTRPSLFAEPVVLRYGDEESPSIILAIGSKGTGGTNPTKESEYFLIDVQGLKDDAEAKYAEIENSLAKLAFAVENTNTLSLNYEDGVVKGDVNIPEEVVVLKENISNIIKTNKDGLYSYVNLEFESKTNTFKFQVNDVVKTFDIPTVVDGKYDPNKESITLIYSDGRSKDIDVDGLIDEWDVEGEMSETPVVLTKVKHTDKEDGVIDRASETKDILKADVRIADTADMPHNILQKTADGKKLFVKGTADNIYYKDGKNVKEVIENIKTDVSDYKENVIYRDYASNGDYKGIASVVKLDYDKETNILKFSSSDTNGIINSKEYKLNSASFIDDITYDTANQTITIRYKDSEGKTQKATIDMSTLLDDWVTNSNAHNVELVKQTSQGKKDVLSADVKLAEKTTVNHQILEEVDHTLVVKGSSDNIYHEKDGNVKAALDRIDSAIEKANADRIDSDEAINNEIEKINRTIGDAFEDNNHANITAKFNELNEKADTEIAERRESDEVFSGAIATEIARAKEAETANANAIAEEVTRATTEEDRIEGKFDGVTNVLTNTIGSGFTSDPHENISNWKGEVEKTFENLINKDDALTSAIDAEVTRATSAEQLNSNAITEEVGRAQSAETSLQTAISNEIARATETEAKNLADTTNYINSNVKTLSDTIGTGFTAYPNENITAKFESLNNNLSNEVTRATSAENTLQNAITAEETRAQSAEASLQTAIDKLNEDTYIKVGETTTIVLNKEDKDSFHTITGRVKRSAAEGNNIIEKEDGIYSNVNLTYTEADNTLHFSVNGGEATNIPLVSHSLIDNIYYNPSKEAIIIEYTVNGVKQDSIEVPVKDLIDEITVSDDKSGAIELAKTHNHSGDTIGPDVISARVVISALGDNIVVNNNGGLYVSGSSVRTSASTISTEIANAKRDEAISSAKTYTDREIGALSADTTSKINAEKERATSAETDLQTAITAESTRAASAETALQTAINSEVTRAKGLENELSGKVNTEITRATSAETALQNAINSENERALVAEQLNSNAIDNEATRAKGEETALQNTITAESTRAISAETALQTAIDNEVNNRGTAISEEAERAKAKENELSGKVTTEVERAKSAETSLQTAITKEETDRKAEDSKLAAAITKEETERKGAVTAEITRAISAETALQTAISNEVTRATSAETALQNGIIEEAERAKTKENELSGKVTTEVTRATSAETALSGAIATEKERALGAESTLQSNLNLEITHRTTADAALDNKITAETQTRINEDGKLLSGITDVRNSLNSEVTNRQNADTALDSKITAEAASRTADTKSIRDSIVSYTTDVKKYADEVGVNTLAAAKADSASKDEANLATANSYTDSKVSASKTEILASASTMADNKDAANLAVAKEYTNAQIAKASLTGGSTTTTDTTITGQIVSIDVKTGGIIKVDANNGGVYANNSILTYDNATNKITFTDNLGVQNTFTLNGVSFIEGANYDESTHKLTITYKDQSGSVHNITVDLTKLIVDVEERNTGNTVAVTVSNVTDVNGISTRYISADLNIATGIANNILKVDNSSPNHSVYADGTGIVTNANNIEALSGKVATNETKLSDLARIAVGNTDPSLSYATTNYISGQTTMKDADVVLDGQIKTNADSISNLSNSLNNVEFNLEGITPKSGNDSYGRLKGTMSLQAAIILLAQQLSKLAQNAILVDADGKNGIEMGKATTNGRTIKVADMDYGSDDEDNLETN